MHVPTNAGDHPVRDRTVLERYSCYTACRSMGARCSLDAPDTDRRSESLGWGWGSELVQKLPKGRWVTQTSSLLLVATTQRPCMRGGAGGTTVSPCGYDGPRFLDLPESGHACMSALPWQFSVTMATVLNPSDHDSGRARQFGIGGRKPAQAAPHRRAGGAGGAGGAGEPARWGGWHAVGALGGDGGGQPPQPPPIYRSDAHQGTAGSTCCCWRAVCTT